MDKPGWVTDENIDIALYDTIANAGKASLWLIKALLKGDVGDSTAGRWSVVMSCDGVSVATDGTDLWGATFDTPIVINVTDAVGLGMVLLEVDFAPFGSKAPERIAVGDGFSPPYAASSRVAIAGGYQYTVRRAGGWPAAPRFNVWATDRAGNEV